jgi:hypothetical protein
MSADVTNPRRRLWAAILRTSLSEEPASRKSRLTTAATTRPSIRVSRSSPCGEKEQNSGPFFCSRMASHASTAATAHGPCSSRGTACSLRSNNSRYQRGSTVRLALCSSDTIDNCPNAPRNLHSLTEGCWAEAGREGPLLSGCAIRSRRRREKAEPRSR